MTEKPKNIQEMMDEIKEKYFDEKHGFADLFQSGKYVGMKEVQKLIEEHIQEELEKSAITKSGYIVRDDVRERVVVLMQLHGQL